MRYYPTLFRMAVNNNKKEIISVSDDVGIRKPLYTVGRKLN